MTGSIRASDQLSFPQLHIPQLPNIIAVPTPKPVKRLPPVGYDMRTLRKQMEALYVEIEERSNWQNVIFEQNEELVQYTSLLLESNKSNVNCMRHEVQYVGCTLCIMCYYSSFFTAPDCRCRCNDCTWSALRFTRKGSILWRSSPISRMPSRCDCDQCVGGHFKPINSICFTPFSDCTSIS